MTKEEFIRLLEKPGELTDEEYAALGNALLDKGYELYALDHGASAESVARAKRVLSVLKNRRIE